MAQRGFFSDSDDSSNDSSVLSNEPEGADSDKDDLEGDLPKPKLPPGNTSVGYNFVPKQRESVKKHGPLISAAELKQNDAEFIRNFFRNPSTNLFNKMKHILGLVASYQRGRFPIWKETTLNIDPELNGLFMANKKTSSLIYQYKIRLNSLIKVVSVSQC
jgi:hypothetical protein